MLGELASMAAGPLPYSPDADTWLSHRDVRIRTAAARRWAGQLPPQRYWPLLMSALADAAEREARWTPLLDALDVRLPSGASRVASCHRPAAMFVCDWLSRRQTSTEDVRCFLSFRAPLVRSAVASAGALDAGIVRTLLRADPVHALLLPGNRSMSPALYGEAIELLLRRAASEGPPWDVDLLAGLVAIAVEAASHAHVLLSPSHCAMLLGSRRPASPPTLENRSTGS